MKQVLIGGQWRSPASAADGFAAVDPSTGRDLPGRFPVSTWAEVEETLEWAHRAVDGLREAGPDAVGSFLDRYALAIEGRAEELVRAAEAETGLPAEPRLRSAELPRTVDQIRQAAAAARDRSWCRATIDSAANVRSLYGPLAGPVVVMGPNNFPFAFNSAAGGDFAAAVAAGNPVIAKANTGHPETTRLFAEAALEALLDAGLPGSTVQLLYRLRPEEGLRLVGHPLVGATAFTGGRESGLRLKEAADRAGKPVYLEMSSVNPVFLLPGALQERGSEIAREFFGSCTLGAGQFCTNPGLVILIDGDLAEAFLSEAATLFDAGAPGLLLGSQGIDHIARAVAAWEAAGARAVSAGGRAEGPGFRYRNTLFRVSGSDFLRAPEALQAEAFGPVSLLVFAADEAELLEIAQTMTGNLTGCVYSRGDGQDDPLYDALEPRLRAKVGRLLNDKMPTGVAVVAAMNHGGPYPATGHPGFTAVGIPVSLLRFGALRCYDNVRAHRLPPELRDRNPTGKMWRLVDGEWTTRNIET